MFGFGHKAAGVSIEQTGIRYIRFKNKNPKQVPKKRGLPLPPGLIVENQVADKEALIDLLKPWVKKKGLRGSMVDVSIPPSQMLIRKMTIPSTAEKQIDQLIKLEVETGLHLPFENPVYDYVLAGQTETESELVLFAAPRKVAQDYVDVLEGAGLKVRSIEVSATALARSITAGFGHDFEETMLIHMEQSLLDIYMFRSGNPVFMRTIDLVDLEHEQPQNLGAMAPFSALSEVAAAAEEHLTAGQIVEITAEISRMLSFYQYSLHDGSTRITEVLITGTPELRRQLQEELQAALPELAIASISLDQVVQGAKPQFGLNEYRLAAGVALRDSSKRNINLLPRIDREAALFPVLAIVLAAVWVLGVAATGVWYGSTHKQINDQSAQIQSLQDRNMELQLQLTALNHPSRDQGFDRNAIIKALSENRADAVAVLDELQTKLPYGAAIRDINYTFRGDLQLTVDFTSIEHSAAYLTSLRSMSFTTTASIEKLSEAAADAYGATLGNNKFQAVYRINMAPEGQANGQTTSPADAQTDIQTDGLTDGQANAEGDLTP